MARLAADHLAELASYLPQGDFIDLSPDSGFVAFLTPLATQLADLDEARDTLLAQYHPLAATELLDDYERHLAPDPCRRDLNLAGLDARRRYVALYWDAAYDITPRGLELLAAALGVTVRVESYIPDVCGEGECGDGECSPEEEVYVWTIRAPGASLIDGECGASECGEPINDFEAPTWIECVLRQWVPLHVYPVFSYDLEA